MSDNEIEAFSAWLASEAEVADQLCEQLVALCESPGGLKRVGQSAVLEYRCAARRCLLLMVWRTPAGLMFYQPAYRLEAKFNEQHSTAAGRARNAVDGDRTWKAQAGVLDGRYRGLPNGGGLELRCGHVGRPVSGDELLDGSERATPGHAAKHFL